MTWKLTAGVLCAAACFQATAQDKLVLPVGTPGVSAMEFVLEASGAIRTADALFYQGSASLSTPMGPIVLAGAELRFEYAPGTDRVQSVTGKAFVPTPLSGSDTLPVSIADPVMAELGYGLGETLTDLGVPLQPKRGYLYFKFDSELTIRYGKEESEDLEPEVEPSFSISFPAGAKSRIVVDPLDPMFYFSGSVRTPKRKSPEAGNDGKPGTGEQGDDGVTSGSGTSKQGLFPFRPLVTWGVEDKARPFNGQRILTGTFPLYGLPLVTVRGHLITNLDPLGTGDLAIDPFGIGFGPMAQAGANGRFSFSLDFMDIGGLGNFANLMIPLGQATAAVEIVNGRQLAYISGIIETPPDLGMGLLLSGQGQYRAAGLVSTNLADCRLLMEGHFKVGPSELARFAGFSFGDILHAEGKLEASRTGFYLLALTEAGVNMGPLTSGAQVKLEMSAPSNRPQDAFVELTGRLELADLGIEGKGRVEAQGMTVTGEMEAGKLRTGVKAEVKRAPATGIVSIGGSLLSPDVLHPDLNATLRQVARDTQQELDRTLTAMREATRNYEFELSLRGIRPAIPPAMDTVVAEVDRQIVANINARWPKLNTFLGTVEAPGKSEAIRYARNQADPYMDRLRELKRLAQTGDNTAVRAALERELLYWIGNPRLRITYRVPVVNVAIVIYDSAILDAAMRQRLQVALNGLRALPDASDKKVKAEQVWNLLPKRELLLAVGNAIENGSATGIPRVESVGFRAPLGRAEWDFEAVVLLQGKRYRLTVPLRPGQAGNLGIEIATAFAKLL